MEQEKDKWKEEEQRKEKRVESHIREANNSGERSRRVERALEIK